MGSSHISKWKEICWQWLVGIYEKDEWNKSSWEVQTRLVEKGYSQVKGVNFGNIFSHVVQLNFIRVLLYLATTFDHEIEHMDVKTTLLHGDLKEEIYMK